MQFSNNERYVHYLRNREWSNSALESFNKCKYSFYRTYLLRDRRDLVIARFGNACHEYCEKYVNKQSPDKYDIFWKNQVPSFEKANYEFAIDNLERFINTEILPFRCKAEYSHKAEVGKYRFIFKFDILCFRGTKVYLYDIKSSKNTNYSSTHQPQIDLYTYILREIFPDKEIIPQLYYVRTNEIYPMVPNKLTKESISAKVEEVLNCENFIPMLNSLCNYCVYQKSDCPEFK